MTVANPYTWGLGRRKSAVARVRIKAGTGNFVVNGKPLDDYFTTLRDQKLAQAPLTAKPVSSPVESYGTPDGEGGDIVITAEAPGASEAEAAAAPSVDVWCNVKGGGPHGQAGAVQLGLARALKGLNPAMMETLRENGLLTRDPRMKERKKPGRRGARRGFQWCKR